MLKSVSLNALIVAIGKLAQFLVIVVLARTLGPDDFGVYVFIVTLVGFFTIPAQAGIPNLIVRELGAHDPLASGFELRSIAITCARVGGVTILATFALVLAAQFIMQSMPGRPAFHLWLFVYIAVPLLVIQGFAGAFLRGLGAVTFAAIPREAVYSLALLALVLMAAPDQTDAALSLFICAVMVSCLVALALIATKWRASGDRPFPVSFTAGQMLQASIPFAAIALLYFLTQRVDIMLLPNFVSKEQLGIYGLAAQIVLVAGLPLHIFNGIAAPRIARTRTSGDRGELIKIYGTGSLGLMGISTVSLGIFAIFGDALIVIIFGEAYGAAYWPCLILLAGQWVNQTAGPSGVVLNMYGFEKVTLAGFAIGASAAIVLNLFLIPIFGILGSAIAFALTMVVWNAFVVWKTCALVRVAPGPLAYFRRAQAER